MKVFFVLLLVISLLIGCTQNSAKPKVIEEKITPKITSYHVEGSLGKSYELPCISMNEAKSSYTPPDLYSSSAKCVLDGRDKDSAQIFALAGAYAIYDSFRVSDRTAKGARTVLIMNNFNPIEQAKKKGYQAVIHKLTDPSTPESKEFCSNIQAIGKPNYHPQYMILHGMDAVMNRIQGDGLIKGYNAKENWAKVLGIIKWCDWK